MNRQDERRRPPDGDADVGMRLTYLLVGAGIGAVVALLFAPKSGHELRGDIADATRKGIDRTREAANQITDRASGYYEGARDKAGEIAGVAREAASRKGGQFTAALEAGKQAYHEEKRKTEVSGLPDSSPPYYEAPKS